MSKCQHSPTVQLYAMTNDEQCPVCLRAKVERLRGLLRECEPAVYAAHVDRYGTRIAKPSTLLSHVRAALAGADQSSPADGKPAAEGVARAEVVPNPYGEGRTDQPSAVQSDACDAARYRWLRSRCYVWSNLPLYREEQDEPVAIWLKESMTLESMDSTIDRLRAAVTVDGVKP